MSPEQTGRHEGRPLQNVGGVILVIALLAALFVPKTLTAVLGTVALLLLGAVVFAIGLIREWSEED